MCLGAQIFPVWMAYGEWSSLPLSPHLFLQAAVFFSCLYLHALSARQIPHEVEPGLIQWGKRCRDVPQNIHDQSLALAWPPRQLWHKLRWVVPSQQQGEQQLRQRAVSEPPLLISTAPFSHMVTFASSSITPYNENTGIHLAATLVFHECLDIYVPPRDIMLCQDFILVALSTLIKAVPTSFSHVTK